MPNSNDSGEHGEGSPAINSDAGSCGNGSQCRDGCGYGRLSSGGSSMASRRSFVGCCRSGCGESRAVRWVKALALIFLLGAAYRGIACRGFEKALQRVGGGLSEQAGRQGTVVPLQKSP